MRPEQGKRLPHQEPLEIISNRSSFDITIPSIKKRVLLKVSPDGFVSTKIEILKTVNADEEKLKAEVQFTEITRNLILKEIRSKIAKQMPGSEGIGAELSVNSLRGQFEQVAETLLGIGYSEEKIKKLVVKQGKQIAIGETHMGEMSSPVKEEVVSLNTELESLFKFLKEKKVRK